VGAANGTVVVWNAESRGELFVTQAHRADVVAVDLSSDRRWLATGALEAGGTTFKVWELREHPVDLIESFSDYHHIGGVWTVCFSPDGRLVASGGWTNSGYTMPLLYEVKSGKRAGRLHWDMTRAMRFSPDGKELVTGDEFGTVKLWRIGEEMPVRQVKAHGDTVTAVGFSSDGTRYFSGGGGTVKVWDKSDGGLLREFPADGGVLACRFIDKGLVLLVASAASEILRPHIQRLDLRPA